MIRKIWHWLVGRPRDPLSTETWRKVALIAFFAWIGLGSDGLSSANYGPETAFRTLLQYPMLGGYLAIAIAVTVFVIAAAYNQVVRLFPNGGGGYRVANALLHPIAGVLSGAALIVDYILTIAISVAAASDALFSLLPAHDQFLNLPCKLMMVIILVALNLRGMKESILVLMPIFLGFVITHFVLIIYGTMLHAHRAIEITSNIHLQTASIIHHYGLWFLFAFMLKAYSMGGGTYTGLEAVSNNVNVLAEPRVQTGKWTMLYMALSLSITAGGIILLYMLWNIHPVPGETFNAIVFTKILSTVPYHHLLLIITLAFEAGILLLGANTGFLGGPAVLANMAVDQWMPSQFNNISNRLVKQNGVLFFGIGAFALLLLSDGHVDFLVIVYSTSVFLTFATTLFALGKYWIQEHSQKGAIVHIILSVFGLIICLTILITLLATRFFQGAWLCVVVIAAIFALCYRIKKYYRRLERKLSQVKRALKPTDIKPAEPTEIDKNAPTAAIFVNEDTGVGIYTFLNINNLFPKHYKNYIFIQVGVVDAKSLGAQRKLSFMKKKVEKNLEFFVSYARSFGFSAKAYAEFDTNAVQKLYELADEVHKEYPNTVFYCGRIVYQIENIFTRLLHSDIPTELQQKLHYHNMQMIILPAQLQSVTAEEEGVAHV